MKDLSTKKGTIAQYLSKNKEKIWACGDDIAKMKAVVLELLSAKEIASNPATPEAIRILSKTRGNQFLSTLVTYMSGLKIGR